MLGFRRSDSQPRPLLYLLFELGNESYALETGCVIRLLPFIHVERIAQAPPGIAGTIDYGDKPVPVIDLCYLALGRSAARCLSTRIVLLNHVVCGEPVVLGAVVERATRTTRSEPAGGTSVMRNASTLLAHIDADRLLSETLAHAPFSAHAAGR